MNSMQIQDQLDEVRVRLLEALTSLPEDAMLQPNAIGDWSIGDLLAHFVNWEAEMVTAFNRIDQGKKPTRLLTALKDRDAYNAERYEEVKGRELDSIFNDLQGVRTQLEGWLEEFSDKELEDRNYYPWLNGKALWWLIGQTSFIHESEHAHEVEAFVESWLAEHNSDVDLTDIEVTQDGDRP